MNFHLSKRKGKNKKKAFSFHVFPISITSKTSPFGYALEAPRRIKNEKSWSLVTG